MSRTPIAPTFTRNGETFAFVERADRRRHGSACECCGALVQRGAPVYALGRRVVILSCAVRASRPAVAAPAVDHEKCAGCRCALPASVEAAVYGGLRYCTHACRYNVTIAQRFGVAP